MARFWDIRTLQGFTSAHAPIGHHFNLDLQLYERAIFKASNSAAMAEWRGLAA
jgi:putative transposase